MRRKGERSRLYFELKRQSVHAAGFLYAVALFLVGREATMIFACAVLAGAIYIGAMRHRSIGLFREIHNAFHSWVSSFERTGEPPLQGLITYSLGVLAAVSLFPAHVVVPAILVLAFGDSLSTVAGRMWGKDPLFFNNEKSWEGSGAFFFVSLAVLLFFTNPIKAVAVAALAAVVEGLPRFDDNITIPLAVALLLTI